MQQIGRYEILEEVGRGAMGVVFKGRDPLIGRAVAVKTITAGVAESADLLERFYREARAAGGLQHPNIVTIYEMAESGGAPFIAMEYLEGESLEKLIARKPALPMGTKIGYVVQACRALDFAHRRGVIHRDVKPANIVVTRDAMVKVVDFGIARIADTSKTQTGALLGTLAYMSPEQLRGQPADASCDIWALGVVLYELLAYQRPFTGDNHAAVLLSILQDEPRPLRQIIPECPAELEKIIARVLIKNDKERYQTMHALLRDLESIAGSMERGTGAVAVSSRLPVASAQQTATQRIDVQALHDAAQARVSTAAAPPAPMSSKTAGGASPPGLLPKRALQPSSQPRESRKPSRTTKARSRTKAVIAYSLLAVTTVLLFPAVRQRRTSSALQPPAMQPNAPAPAQPLNANSSLDTQIPDLASQPLAPTAVSLPGPDSAGSPLEGQQRQFIEQARQSADAHDYKAAQSSLDDAAKLNGPLNSLIADLRQQFSQEAYEAELKVAANQEQALWNQAMAELQEGRFDDAEKSLRNLLVLPAGTPHWSDAERYVDQVIPERRQEQQLWLEAQMEGASAERGHLLKQIKALDEVMGEGGPHGQQARQKRDAIIRQIVRENARRNGLVDPTLSPGYEAHLAELEAEFGKLAIQNDAAALEGLQELRLKFKDLADAGGPLAMDARDYASNVIPKTQKRIEDNLAALASDLSANAAYERAVKDYGRATATQNLAELRGRVLPSFQEIANSGGIRAREADRYVRVLIPAAVKKTAP